MDGEKNAAAEAESESLPPPYSSPQHQANAVASAGIYLDVMMMNDDDDDDDDNNNNNN